MRVEEGSESEGPSVMEGIGAQPPPCVFGTVPRVLYGTYKKIYINNRKKIKKKKEIYIKNVGIKKNYSIEKKLYIKKTCKKR
jgi:hypothetical protein